MENPYIIIDDVKFYHGDKISAVVHCHDEDCEIEDARLCINDLNEENAVLCNFYICQNECDGDAAAKEKFGYRHSWNFKVNPVDNRICSTDTISIKSREKREVEDDDPMPEDWVSEEKIPEDI